MYSKLPLISCICITDHRIVMLKRAIACFISQDYPNKELVVSYPKKDRLTKHLISRILKGKNLRFVQVERDNMEILGDTRNTAIFHANGEYICNWDDDDWYHSSRLSYQFNAMKEANSSFQASILNQVILYDGTKNKAYLSFPYVWENTLLCQRNIFIHNKYKSKHKGEDSNIIDYLNLENLLFHVQDVPYLYIYTYHMGNTWGYSHFKSFFSRSSVLDDELTKKISLLLI